MERNPRTESFVHDTSGGEMPDPNHVMHYEPIGVSRFSALSLLAITLVLIGGGIAGIAALRKRRAPDLAEEESAA